MLTASATSEPDVTTNMSPAAASSASAVATATTITEEVVATTVSAKSEGGE